LSYTASLVDFSQTTNNQNTAGLGSSILGVGFSDLGYLSLGASPATYSGIFNLLVTFTLPAGASTATMTANLNGQVTTLNNGDVFFDFLNDSSNPLTLSYTGGTFQFFVNDIVAPGTSSTNAITGRLIAAVPEPASWALMLLGFGGMGVAMRRRRQPALAQVA
jgi:hypothetical protein